MPMAPQEDPKNWYETTENLQLAHYKYFLHETAKSMGMSEQELAQIKGFQSPNQVREFIDLLTERYGVTKEDLRPTVEQKDGKFTVVPPTRNMNELRPGEQYNEWATE